MTKIIEITRCTDCPTLSQGEPRSCARVGRRIGRKERNSIPNDCPLPEPFVHRGE